MDQWMLNLHSKMMCYGWEFFVGLVRRHVFRFLTDMLKLLISMNEIEILKFEFSKLLKFEFLKSVKI